MLPSHSPHDEPGPPVLIVRFGSVDEALRPGDGPVFIGRELPAQLRIDDPRISRTHARIESAGAHWLVVDEASTNGVFLNGEKVSTVSIDRRNDTASRSRRGDRGEVLVHRPRRRHHDGHPGDAVAR